MHSVQAVVYIKYIWPLHYLHKYTHRYYIVLRIYSASQQTVSADGLQDNSQHRKTRGIKTAICAPSIRPDLCISNRGSSGICRRASLTSFRGCDPDVANSAGNGGLPPRHPLRLRWWLEDNTRSTCDRCKGDKKTVKYFSSANDMDAGSVPNQLKGLTQAEEILISKGCPIMRVYRPKGGQRGFGGHVVKSQGKTMDKAVVDLGKSESTAGLTFVCLSRAKRLVDLC